MGRPGRRGRSVRLASGGISNTGRYSITPDEFTDWAAGTGRALAEFTTQLTRAKIASSPRRKDRVMDVGAGLPQEDGKIS